MLLYGKRVEDKHVCVCVCTCACIVHLFMNFLESAWLHGCRTQGRLWAHCPSKGGGHLCIHGLACASVRAFFVFVCVCVLLSIELFICLYVLST